MRAALIAILVGMTGCELVGTGGDDSGPSGSGAGVLPTTDWQPEQGGWAGYSHPCAGNRTDAMWWDDKNTAFVGCGTTTIGYGLFTTDDGGATWSAVAQARLSGFRVSSIQRAADGWLYIAGIDTNSSDRVLRLDGSGAIEVVWQAGNQVWNSFHVGTFRRNADGVAVAESLTGSGLVWRASDSADFEDGASWPSDGSSYQILDMVLHGDEFYGVGSTIGAPPRVFVPDSLSPLTLQPVQLADWSGEMWGIAVDDAGVVAGGVDQGADDGMVFVSGANPSKAGSYREMNLSDLVGGGPTWVRGVCRSGPLIAAVGEFSTRNDAILAVSADAGASWHDWTDSLPPGAAALHKCTLWPDGRLAVTGQDGYLAVWTPG